MTHKTTLDSILRGADGCVAQQQLHLASGASESCNFPRRPRL